MHVYLCFQKQREVEAKRKEEEKQEREQQQEVQKDLKRQLEEANEVTDINLSCCYSTVCSHYINLLYWSDSARIQSISDKPNPKWHIRTNFGCFALLFHIMLNWITVGGSVGQREDGCCVDRDGEGSPAAEEEDPGAGAHATKTRGSPQHSDSRTVRGRHNPTGTGEVNLVSFRHVWRINAASLQCSFILYLQATRRGAEETRWAFAPSKSEGNCSFEESGGDATRWFCFSFNVNITQHSATRGEQPGGRRGERLWKS